MGGIGAGMLAAAAKRYACSTSSFQAERGKVSAGG